VGPIHEVPVFSLSGDPVSAGGVAKGTLPPTYPGPIPYTHPGHHNPSHNSSNNNHQNYNNSNYNQNYPARDRTHSSSSSVASTSSTHSTQSALSPYPCGSHPSAPLPPFGVPRASPPQTSDAEILLSLLAVRSGPGPAQASGAGAPFPPQPTTTTAPQEQQQQQQQRLKERIRSPLFEENGQNERASPPLVHGAAVAKAAKPREF